MPAGAVPLLHELRRLATATAADPAPDAELLERFVRRRDAGAFAALVARHGPMVYGTAIKPVKGKRQIFSPNFFGIGSQGLLVTISRPWFLCPGLPNTPPSW
jgi:hypothetical protein